MHNACGDKFITLYHGSIDNATNISKNGLDVDVFRSGATYVTDSLEAAQDAIKYRTTNFPDEVTDPGIIVSRVPREVLNVLDNGRDILSRSYSGFYPYRLDATEYLLKSATAKKLFNIGLRR